jgi:hypothetical protein
VNSSPDPFPADPFVQIFQRLAGFLGYPSQRPQIGVIWPLDLMLIPATNLSRILLVWGPFGSIEDATIPMTRLPRHARAHPMESDYEIVAVQKLACMIEVKILA